MLKTLPDFNKATVLVLGDIMLDRYWFGETGRISPEAPVPVVKIKQIDERPGGAGNVALSIAALGAKVTLIGIAGNDTAAQTLKEQLTAAQVRHEILQFDNIPTITKLRVISRQQQLIRLDFEEKFPIFDTEKLISYYKMLLPSVNLVILSDYGKGTLCCAPTLIKLANNANVPLFVDPKGSDFSIYHGANIITPNLKEFETIVGPCENESDIAKKALQFLIQYEIPALLLTRGERGMTLFQNTGESLNFPAHAREVYDVTGAGDSVIAVLGTAYASGATLPESTYLANLAASLAVAKLGAVSVSVPELQAAFLGNSRITTGIVNEEELLLAVANVRAQGKKIVFTNGCFDILHAGHVLYLQQARQLGDYLIVAINDDDSVKKLKGLGRPINPVSQRLAVLNGLSMVDWVTSFKDPTPERLLKLLRPEILVKGGDYQIDEVVGAEIVQAYGGEVRVLGVVEDLSTTLIINRMIKSTPVEETLS